MNYFIGILFILSVVFSACSSNEEEQYKRTIIVYLGRDNNLSGSGEDKISSMLEGWDGEHGNLIVYQDIAGGKSSLLQAYRQNGTNDVKTIYENENENSADPDVFRRVIHDAITFYPADSYGLILFSHATGWLPELTYSSPRSLIIDTGEDEQKEMELKDFAAAIPDGCFDFIIFEACYMAGIEVAYELKDKTDYILASSAEIVSPGFKEIYASSFNKLFTREAHLKSFTEDIYNLFSTSDAYYKSGTFSLIRTVGLRDLANYLNANIDITQTVDMNDIQSFDTKRYYHLFFDFEDCYSRILKSQTLHEELTKLIDNCIIYKGATPLYFDNNPSWGGFVINHHSGLTTYIPREQFPYLNKAYREYLWYKDVFEK